MDIEGISDHMLVYCELNLNHTLQETGKQLTFSEWETKLGQFAFQCISSGSPIIEGKRVLTDVASIQEADDKLKENEVLQQYVLNYLQLIGGTTNKLCINRCLEKVVQTLLANSVAGLTHLPRKFLITTQTQVYDTILSPFLRVLNKPLVDQID
ncbi:hypothetical protein NQ314_006484 [Rhamnusium bicolor]|uniref:Uncharacterized protein n=1 Tax=Rhamnusium bicolor TaxID=1586634 RepID=A0AAV8Z1M4_9CUCU|nr:hypothetical protein NQ314_006484 [Rhamnusium bicolor]